MSVTAMGRNHIGCCGTWQTLVASKPVDKCSDSGLFRGLDTRNAGYAIILPVSRGLNEFMNRISSLYQSFTYAPLNEKP